MFFWRRNTSDDLEPPSLYNLKNEIQIVLVGDKHSGKTALANRLVYNSFVKKYHESTDVTFLKTNFSYQQVNYRISIWDLPGNKLTLNDRKPYYMHADAVFIIANLNNKKYIDNIATWHQEAKENTRKNCAVILVGTKVDNIFEQQLSKKRLLDLSNQLSCDYYELVSAKLNKHIKKLFTETISIIVEKKNLKALPMRHLNARQLHYKRTLDNIWANHKPKRSHTDLYLSKARAVLRDYTKYSKHSCLSACFMRFFTLQWNRHHAHAVERIHNDKSIQTFEQLLEKLNQIKLVNPHGDLASIILFLENKRDLATTINSSENQLSTPNFTQA